MKKKKQQQVHGGGLRKRRGMRGGGKTGAKTRAPGVPDRLDLADLDFIRTVWLKLTPGQRLARSWRMRRLLPDPEKAHDAKIWPRP